MIVPQAAQAFCPDYPLPVPTERRPQEILAAAGRSRRRREAEPLGCGRLVMMAIFRNRVFPAPGGRKRQDLTRNIFFRIIVNSFTLAEVPQ
jgi:hypothetical protein